MSAQVRPTKKQRELLSYIEGFIREHGYSPSYREIMNGLNYTSVATVSLHVNSLIKRGHLIKRDRSARSLEVVKNPGAAPHDAASDSDPKSPEETWLSDRIENFITSLTAMEPDPDNLLKLEIIHEATKLLGLVAIAEETATKLAALRARVSADADLPVTK
jgi:SOS-response transcriptional repressor LexA